RHIHSATLPEWSWSASTTNSGDFNLRSLRRSSLAPARKSARRKAESAAKMSEFQGLDLPIAQCWWSTARPLYLAKGRVLGLACVAWRRGLSSASRRREEPFI